MSNPGNGYEQCIEAVLRQYYPVVNKQVKTNWKGLFGQSIRVDFLFGTGILGTDFCLEVKWQGSKGTTEQKLVYAVEQIKKCHEVPTYILLGGSGWTNGAVDWAKKQEATDIYLGCLSTDDFFNAVIKGNL